MQIGSHRLSTNLALAPMAGVTDRPFRHLCQKLGAGLLVSEMITCDRRLWHTRKSLIRLPHQDEPGPIAVQIAGADPAMMAEAARRNVDLGAEIIDINMGCPAKKVCRRAAGSALLQDPDRVRRILDAVAAAVAVPVTLKIRTGPAPHWRNAVDIARLAEDCGVRALAVHGRSRACRFRPTVEYETIARVVRATDLPVWANGDIDSPWKAREVLETTGASGIMIGRAARGNPWIFRDTEHYLEHGCLPPPPQARQIREVVRQHLAGLHDLYGEFAGIRIARKHLGWYVGALAGGESFRREFNQLEDAAAQQRAVERFFQTLEMMDNPFRADRYPRGSGNSDGRENNGARAA